jgi:hypothetical protein
MNAHVSGLSVATMLLALAPAGAAAAPEPPVAPSPDAPAAAVQPATFVAPASAPRTGGLPLTAAAPAAAEAGGKKPFPRQPLPDWRLLAAIGAAFAVLAVVRTRAGRGRPRLPADVFEVLGEAAVGGGQAVRIVRFGPKTLLVGVSSAGVRTLAEISDVQSTECIVAACRGSQAAGQAAGRGSPRPKPAGPRPVPPVAPAGEAA